MGIDILTEIRIDDQPFAFMQKLKDENGNDAGIRITFSKTSKIVSGTMGLSQEHPTEGNFVDIFFPNMALGDRHLGISCNTALQDRFISVGYTDMEELITEEEKILAVQYELEM